MTIKHAYANMLRMIDKDNVVRPGQVQPVEKTPMTMKQRVKVGAAATALVIAGNFAAPFANNLVERARGPEVPELVPGAENTTTYVVQPGDTAYGIADRAVDGDPRGVQDALTRQDAALDGLQEGDELIVPATGEFDPNAEVAQDQDFPGGAGS